MRKELKCLKHMRATFTGTFERSGTKTSFGHTKQTLLFTNIRDSDGRIVADHLWFNLTKGFAALGLLPGDAVRFNARCKSYEKGYKGYRDDVFDKPIEIDYKLSHPSKLQKILSEN